MGNKVNEMVFEQAIRTAESIHKMFGQNCEAVVHDFSNLEKSLIHVSGTLTSREIGSPATDLVLKELNKQENEINDIPNYSTISNSGIVMKSSTVFLRDINNNVIGALCINFNISMLASLTSELQDFIQFEEHVETSESFYSTVHDVIEEMVKQVVQEFNQSPHLLSMDEKIAVVRRLEEKGAFLIKGAIEYLATYLNVSKFTVYNYLQKIRAQNEYQIKGVEEKK